MKRYGCAVIVCWFASVVPVAFAAEWADKFDDRKKDFATTGKNAYFVLELGYQLVFDGREAGEQVHLTIMVLNETKMVDGLQTRVIEEKETHDSKLAEVSHNYFALDTNTADVYYFGEDVDEYKDGKIASHGGSWLFGMKSARYGLMMPARNKVGDRYYQEVAPKIARHRAETISVTESVTIPAGKFQDCMKTEETTPLEPKSKEYKPYGPSVGLVVDGSL